MPFVSKAKRFIHRDFSLKTKNWNMAFVLESKPSTKPFHRIST